VSTSGIPTSGFNTVHWEHDGLPWHDQSGLCRHAVLPPTLEDVAFEDQLSFVRWVRYAELRHAASVDLVDDEASTSPVDSANTVAVGPDGENRHGTAGDTSANMEGREFEVTESVAFGGSCCFLHGESFQLT
jgi:hypothetical protein